MKYIIIVGCGKTGSRLALEFAASNNVVIIDRNKNALNLLGENFNGKKIVGDALDNTVLDEAGIQDADVLILVTGNDNLNLVLGKVAKRKYEVKKVILQISEENKKKGFLKEDMMVVNRTYLLVEVFKKCIS